MASAAHREPQPVCLVATQAICRGNQDTAVTVVAGAAARPGREHIALRYGRVLLYLEDRAALAALAACVARAQAMADRAFGPPEDAFAEAERNARRYFERTGRTTTRPR